MFTRPAVDVVALADARRPARPLRQGQQPRARAARVRRRAARWRRWPRRSRRRATGQIRALVTFAGNPVLSTPNGRRLERALAAARLHGLDRPLPERDHAPRAPHPAADRALEHDHYDVVFHALAVRNTAQVLAGAVHAAAGRRHDWEILLELARRLDAAKGRRGWQARLTHAPAARAWARAASSTAAAHRSLRAAARRSGRASASRACEAAPHGIDLGPARALPAGAALHAGPAHRARAGPLRARTSSACGARPGRSARRERAAAHRPPRPALEQLVDAQQPSGS